MNVINFEFGFLLYFYIIMELQTFRLNMNSTRPVYYEIHAEWFNLVVPPNTSKTKKR